MTIYTINAYLYTNETEDSIYSNEETLYADLLMEQQEQM